MVISRMLTMPSFKKSLIVEQFQGNYHNVTFFLILYSRKLSTMILNFGAREMPIILQGGKTGFDSQETKLPTY